MAYSITVDQVAARLGKQRPAGEGAWYCSCPAHEDNKASLWVKQREGGGLHVKCHAGCARENVEQRLRAMGAWPGTGVRKPDPTDHKRKMKAGEEIDEIISPVPEGAPPIEWGTLSNGRPTALYEYKDLRSQLIGYVGRWDTLTGQKDIRPLSLARLKNGQVKWVMKAPPGQHPLYRLPELLANPKAKVLIVEGEKTAQAAAKLLPEYVVLCWRGGAAALGKTDFSPLKNREVTLWPDADEPGLIAMQAVADILRKVGAATILIVAPPPGVPKGWDIADDIPAGVDLISILNDAEPATLSQAPSSEPIQSVAEDTGLRPYVLTASDILKRDIPARKMIVDPFLAASSLIMIYGPRGGGKTWVCLSLALAIAQGKNFIGYEVCEPLRVLYVDGEMAFAELQERLKMLAPSPPDTMYLLPSELLYREATPLNLHLAETQAAIEDVLNKMEAEGNGIHVIIFDNLSSLSGGVDENDNSALDALLKWLIHLRHMGLAVILVHHAGKSGAQRGASRREDLLDTSIVLSAPPDDSTPHEGAHVVLSFAKLRGKRPKRDQLELKLVQNRDHLEWSYAVPVLVDRATELLRMIWEKKPKTQSELAVMAKVKEAAISHQIKKLKLDGFVDNNPLAVLDLGRQRLIEVWPELEQAMMKQGEFPFKDEGII